MPQTSSLAKISNDLPPLTHNFAEIPFEEQAQKLILMIKDHQFSEVESIIQQHVENRTSSRGGNYYPDSIVNAIFSFDDSDITKDTEFFGAIEQWIKESPRSSMALLFRSKIYYNLAWELRGQKYRSETPEASHENYRAVIKESIADLQDAYSLDPDHPLILLDFLQIGRNFGIPRQDFELYFNQLIQENQFLTAAYTEKAMYLAPQWNGSKRELLRFVHESIEKAPRSSNMPMIVIQAHDSLARRAGASRYYQQPEVWADIEFSYTRLVEDFPKAGLYAAWFADMANKVNKKDIANKYIDVALSREPNHPEILKIKAKIAR